MKPTYLLSLLLLVGCSTKEQVYPLDINNLSYGGVANDGYFTNDLIVANFEYGFLEGGNDQYSFSIKSNRIPTYESVFTLKMRDGNWDNSAATNIVLTTIYEPIVTKSNDQWVITFKEKRK